MPGVLLVLTGDDVKADGLGDVPCHAPLNSRDGKPRHDTPRPVLAIGKVRHVGQPVALVVAETLPQAQDAAEAIEIDYETLPAVTDARAALAKGAPQLFDGIPGNLVFDWDNDTSDFRRDRRGLRQGRARHHAGDGQQPRGRELDGAAQRDRRLGRRDRSARCSTPARRARISCAIRSPRPC